MVHQTKGDAAPTASPFSIEGGALQNYALLADNVTIVFVELPIFIRCADDLFSDQDLAELQNTLLENPGAGDASGDQNGESR